MKGSLQELISKYNKIIVFNLKKGGTKKDFQSIKIIKNSSQIVSVPSVQLKHYEERRFL